jgi:hypothetical protein
MTEPRHNPDGLDRIRAPLAALALLAALAATQCGCGGAAGITGVAGVLKTTLDVIRVTRGIICTTALDAIAGNPREGQPEWIPKPAADASTTAADAAGD